MTTLFISHHSSDNDWAKAIKDDLEVPRAGQRARQRARYEGVFLDSDCIRGGEEWEQRLYRELRRARSFICLCTPAWVRSPWCVAEALLAREREIPIIPLVPRTVALGAGEVEQLAERDAEDRVALKQRLREAGVDEEEIERILAARPRPPRLPDVIPRSQVIRAEDADDEQALPALRAALDGRRLCPEVFGIAEIEHEGPYPGLQPFDRRHAGVFYGREDDIKELTERLKQRRSGEPAFMVVLGASGAGKSSLVRAGVIPRMDRWQTPGADGAFIVTAPVTAGEGLEGLQASLAALAERVEPASGPDDAAGGGPGALPGLVDAVRQAFAQPLAGDDDAHSGTRRERVEALAKWIATLRKALVAQRRRAQSDEDAPSTMDESSTRPSVLLVLDQLEEAFRAPSLGGARPVGAVLLDALLDLAAIENTPVTVLATMRSEYLDTLQQFRAGTWFQTYPLNLLGRDAFAAVIDGPAARFGLRVADELRTRLIEDTGHDDALPLLSYTLKKLHEDHITRKPNDPVVSGDNYQGVQRAVEHKANEVIKKVPLDAEGNRALRRVLLGLAVITEDGQVTRCTAREAALDIPPAVQPLIERLVDNRLLLRGTNREDESTLTVAHEALFRVWGTLAAWIDDAKRALRERGLLLAAAREWRDADEARKPGLAWGDARVMDAVQEIAANEIALQGADEEEAQLIYTFLGPTEPSTIELLVGRVEPDPEFERYGPAWQVPLSPLVRKRAGDRLALAAINRRRSRGEPVPDPQRIGDDRPGVGLTTDGLPDIAWCAVPGAHEVSIEIRKQDETNPDSAPDERMSRPVASFRIARYPVTRAQFQAFLDDGEGLQRQWAALKERIGTPADQDYPAPDIIGDYGNYPANNVNWWDAWMFCAWLDEHLRGRGEISEEQCIRLPTELEWQLAATANEPDRVYPWGQADPVQEPWRANTKESGLHGPTAVGLHPAGGSFYGGQDMAGTIWEWCATDFDQLDTTGIPTLSARGRRALRGGSWRDGRHRARAVFRAANLPFNRDGYVGFRVCVASPIVDH